MTAGYAAPLSAVDRLWVATRRNELVVTARKLVVADDPYLPGHFPGQPIYPGVFIVETVRQAVAAAVGERAGVVPELSAIGSVRFLVPLTPGDELCVEVVVRPGEPGGAVGAQARCRLGDGTEAARLTLELRYRGSTDA